jgi:hypothetical protein
VTVRYFGPVLYSVPLYQMAYTSLTAMIPEVEENPGLRSGGRRYCATVQYLPQKSLETASSKGQVEVLRLLGGAA